MAAGNHVCCATYSNVARKITAYSPSIRDLYSVRFSFCHGMWLFRNVVFKLWGYVNNIHQYPDAAPWAVGNFLMLVSQSFAIGGLTTDRGNQHAPTTNRPQIENDGRDQGIALQILYIAIATLIVSAVSTIGTWLPLIRK
ncbi:hypothetical protein [Methylobacterium sp. R2-1]|uniref:hypothetical protein n=1 Tax=Methylobacterium sp. R2-1 TaxID=2587064 RepID=UPI00161340F1|nr:hypothetical protein [Methylobacterium sp. R2-1]MBB2964282.1 hypothetical protein [Methylobacterium sp. R2-1]